MLHNINKCLLFRFTLGIVSISCRLLKIILDEDNGMNILHFVKYSTLLKNLMNLIKTQFYTSIILNYFR